MLTAILALATAAFGYFLHVWANRIQKTDQAYEAAIEGLISGIQKQEAAHSLLANAVAFHGVGEEDKANRFLASIDHVFKDDNAAQLPKIMATAFLYCDQEVIDQYFMTLEPLETEFRKYWYLYITAIAAGDWDLIELSRKNIKELLDKYAPAVRRLILLSREKNNYLTILAGILPRMRGKKG